MLGVWGLSKLLGKVKRSLFDSVFIEYGCHTKDSGRRVKP